MNYEGFMDKKNITKVKFSITSAKRKKRRKGIKEGKKLNGNTVYT